MARVLCQGGLWDGVEFRSSACPAVLPLQYLPRPIRFPGCVPNSAVLQRMWLPWEVGRLGALAQLTSRRRRPKARGGAQGGLCGRGTESLQGASSHSTLSPLQPRPSLDSLWQPWVIRRRHAKEHQKQIQWLEEEEEEEEEQQDLDLDWASDSLSPHGELSESEEPEAQVGTLGWASGRSRQREAEPAAFPLLPRAQRT